MYKLKKYLDYGGMKEDELRRKQEKEFKRKIGDEIDLDKESRAKMMKDLLSKVKSNKDLFLNNKLDDLLADFGERKCRSCIEWPTGWEKELDPRKIRTAPLTPNTRDLYEDEYHFGPNDAYGDHPDNCYADGNDKIEGVDSGIQGDMGKNEFEMALHRK